MCWVDSSANLASVLCLQVKAAVFVDAKKKPLKIFLPMGDLKVSLRAKVVEHGGEIVAALGDGVLE